jgi:EmrB/QacA subfamily drug resistance transporter
MLGTDVTAPVMRESAPKRAHHGLALAVITTTQLMVVLDISVVNVALPSIQRALHFSPINLEWIINGYTLAFGGLLLLGGRLGDLFGRRRMFIFGTALFTVASLAGGLATDQGWLIAARVVQGLGGAIASPTALSLIASTFEEGPERNRAMGVYAAMSGAGGAIGGILGGVLTSELGWRWVLFVNLPIGLVVTLLAPRVLPETVTHRGRLDLPGALSATAGVSLLVYGLIHAANHSWSSSGTVIPIVIAVVLLVGFVLLETRTDHALMPLRVFTNRGRAGAYLVALMVGGALFAMFFFLTLFMQNILGFSALRTGLSFTPFAVGLIIASAIAAQLVGKIGVRIPLAIGLLMAVGGLIWLSLIGPESTYWADLFGPMILIAPGMGFSFVPLTLAAVNSIDVHDSGIASAVLNTAQQVGGSLGLAVLGTIAAMTTNNRLASHFGSHAPALTGGLPSTLSPSVQHVVDTAITSGYVYGFRIGAAALFVGFLFAVGVVRVRNVSGMPALIPSS